MNKIVWSAPVQSRPKKRQLIWSIAGIVMGLVFIAMGVFSLVHEGNSCGRSDLQEGQTCTTISRGHATTRDLGDQQHHNHRLGWTVGGIGLFFTAAGGWLLYEYRRDNREMDAREATF